MNNSKQTFKQTKGLENSLLWHDKTENLSLFLLFIMLSYTEEQGVNMCDLKKK